VLIEHSVNGKVGRLRLARPEKRNALSAAMVQEGIAAVDRLVASGVRVAVLEADGPVFCAGDDISPAEQGPGRVHTADGFVEYLTGAPLFWVATVGAPVLGAGVALVAGCPVVLCSQGSWFRLPERNSGNFPRFVVDRIAPVVGIRKAIGYAAGGAPISAAAAVAAGLATEAVPDQTLTARTAEWLDLLASQPQVAELAAARWSQTWHSGPASTAWQVP
jgi:enoyl-CoA hydratase/carnithine racemase